MRLSAVCLLAVLLLPAGSIRVRAGAVGQDAAGPEIAGVRVGVAGRYKPGCWTQVKVAVRHANKLDNGRLTLTVPDGDGIPSRFSTPLPSPAPTAKTGDTPVILYARFGRVRSELAVELRAGDQVVDREVFKPRDGADYLPAVLSEQQLVVIVGRAPLGVEDAVRRLRQGPDRRTVVVRLEDFQELPTEWYGYEAIDTVVLSTSDPQIYAGLRPASPRVAALEKWIQMGGRLILCLGEHAREVLSGEPGAALKRFIAPGRLEKMVTMRRTSDLELYCGSSVRIPAMSSGIRVPFLVDVQGKIEAADGPLPLVIRGARGFGQVVFVAADLDRPPFSEWEDRGLLIGKLLGYPATPVDDDEEGTAVMHYGFTDLAGQLRSALDQFPKVRLVPFWLVVGLIVLYILAIGPGDYFLLRKVIGRMQLTWITFPVIVVAFSLTAYLLARTFKGDQIRVNQLELVDVEVEADAESGRRSGRVRGTVWANLFSPRMGRYDLEFHPYLPGGRPAPEATLLTAWLGLPGDALGGMNPRTAEPVAWDTHYDFSPQLDCLRKVPIPIWSTKSLTARWTARTGGALDAQLTDDDGLLRGSIANRLGVPLADCLLAYGRYAYQFESLAPGEMIRVHPNLSRELKSLLTGRRIVFIEEKDDFRPQATPYDRESVDIASIVRAMMFYRASGGWSYTGLSNRYQGFVDSSHLLKTDRAVFVARAETETSSARPHGTELWCNGRPLPRAQVRQMTIYRFVFPVERGK